MGTFCTSVFTPSDDENTYGEENNSDLSYKGQECKHEPLLQR